MNKMNEEKIKKLTQNIRSALRLILALFLFVIGVYIGSVRDIFIKIDAIINLIILLIGIMIPLTIILDEMKDEE